MILYTPTISAHLMSSGKGTINIKGKLAYIVVSLPSEAFLEQNIDNNRYKVQWSVGEGLLNQSPWVAIMDKKITTTPRTDYYVVYLFTTDLKKLYFLLELMKEDTLLKDGPCQVL